MTYKNFSEFHGSVTKQMPDVTRYPEMYNLSYDLMAKSWLAAMNSDRVLTIINALEDIAKWGEDNGSHWCREHARKTIDEFNK